VRQNFNMASSDKDAAPAYAAGPNPFTILETLREEQPSKAPGVPANKQIVSALSAIADRLESLVGRVEDLATRHDKEQQRFGSKLGQVEKAVRQLQQAGPSPAPPAASPPNARSDTPDPHPTVPTASPKDLLTAAGELPSNAAGGASDAALASRLALEHRELEELRKRMAEEEVARAQAASLRLPPDDGGGAWRMVVRTGDQALAAEARRAEERATTDELEATTAQQLRVAAFAQEQRSNSPSQPHSRAAALFAVAATPSPSAATSPLHDEFAFLPSAPASAFPYSPQAFGSPPALAALNPATTSAAEIAAGIVAGLSPILKSLGSGTGFGSSPAASRASPTFSLSRPFGSSASGVKAHTLHALYEPKLSVTPFSFNGSGTVRVEKFYVDSASLTIMLMKSIEPGDLASMLETMGAPSPFSVQKFLRLLAFVVEGEEGKDTIHQHNSHLTSSVGTDFMRKAGFVTPSVHTASGILPIISQRDPAASQAAVAQ
jgi:hypothetical protein